MDFKLAVLGACTCNTSGGQPCPCAKMAAVTRKQLLHLKQEVTLLGLDLNKQKGACAQNQIKLETRYCSLHKLMCLKTRMLLRNNVCNACNALTFADRKL